MAAGGDRRERSGRSHRRRRTTSIDALPLPMSGDASARKGPRRFGGGTGLAVAAMGALALWGLAHRVGREGGVGGVGRDRTTAHVGRGSGGGGGRGHVPATHWGNDGVRAAALLAAGGGAVKMPATYAEMFGDGSTPRKAAAGVAAAAPPAASAPAPALALPPPAIYAQAPVVPAAPAVLPASLPPPMPAEMGPPLHPAPPVGAPLPPPPAPSMALAPAITAGTPPPAGVFRGAAAPGRDQNFWAWFQASKADDEAAARPTMGGALPCPPPGQPSARLCATFYKTVRKYKVRRVVDISCAANVGWMRAVVARLGSELWGFSYVCMAAEAAETASNEAAFAAAAAEQGRAEAGSALAGAPPAVPSWVTFETRRWWKEGFGGTPPAEAGSTAAASAVAASAAAAADPAGGGGGTGDVGLVFAWDVLAHTPYGRVWGFFVRARVDGVGLVLFDNYPGLVNNPSPRRRYLNVRKHPFRFGQATEVVQNVTEGSGEAVRRQMLLYKVSTLPELLTGKG